MKSLPFLVFAIALSAQDTELFRDQLTRISYTPPTGEILADPAARTREVLRLPLHARPNVPLDLLQSTQTALIRLNDILAAEAERAALARPLPSPELIRPATLSPCTGSGCKPNVATPPDSRRDRQPPNR